MKTDYIAENILVSILAVNGWTADRVFPLTERFRAVGLLEFAAISELSIEDIAERLARAGYARGEYMNLLLATRVLSMATALSAIELNRLKQCLVEGRTTDVSDTLEGSRASGQLFWKRSGVCNTH